MKNHFSLFAFLLTFTVFGVLSTTLKADSPHTPDPSVMSEAYYKIWNADVQKQIDERIEKYRKADAEIKLENVKPGTDVKVEQISHEFIFGAHIFNFNQLGTTERNQKYKDLYGTLFNSATIAFYWKKFEMEPGKPRFKTDEWDTEEYWNHAENPNSQPHWRRPASDQVVEFCKSKGIRLHGHTIIWGNQTWQRPTWLWDYVSEQFPEEREILMKTAEARKNMTPEEIYKLAPHYFDTMNELYWNRIRMLGEHYKGMLDSWDVVNESATDYHGQAVTGDKVTNSNYGHIMPGDYTFRSFKVAQEVFPDSVKLNINDYANNQNYANQVLDLIAHGAKIDIVGSQMHLFNPKQTLDIAEGAQIQTPEQVLNTMKILATTGRPIHLSEITITAPNDDEKGRAIQAIVLRNLYRLWFSVPEMMGITWWNVVDGCGAPGEPTTSGLFTRDMQPKPSFFALNKLINEEWKTKFVQKAESGSVDLKFRGFKGKYRITWTDVNGETKTLETVVR
ncbi:MAG: endo-1,4-beta-xylanase [Thermoguttaceae bacterium]|nr:endo-1,4-beta-xylanase [Thermoguttaceae bacterium]